MDPKGKGMVINDKEKETLYVDERKGDKPTDSSSSHKKREGKKKSALRRSSTTATTTPLLHQGMTTMTHLRKGKQLIKTILLIVLASRIIRMLIYYLFHSVNPLSLMEKTIPFGVIKCIAIYFLSILVFGKLWKMECNLTVVTILY
jgi:hypothetical protein